MAKSRAIICSLLLPVVVVAQPYTQSELGWDYGVFNTPTFWSGLIAYYRFNTNGLDSWTNNYHLSPVGAPSYETGKWDFGLTTTPNFFAITNKTDFNLTGDRTFAFWMKNEETVGSYFNYLISQSDEITIGVTDYQIERIAAGAPTGTTNITWIVNNVGLIDSGSPLTNTWVFVIAEYRHDATGSTSSISLQIDMGAMLTATGAIATVNYYSNYFGSAPSSPGASQALDELAIFRRLLTPQEKTNLYNAVEPWFNPPF